MSFWEDNLADFLKDFGESAIIKGGIEIIVIFDNEFSVALPNNGGIEASMPIVTALSSDVDDLSHGDTVKIRGTAYQVVGIQPDGTGFTVLKLSE